MKLISILRMSAAAILLAGSACLLINAASTANAASASRKATAPVTATTSSANEFKVHCNDKSGPVECVVTCKDNHVYETGAISATEAKKYCIDRGSSLVTPDLSPRDRNRAESAKKSTR